MKKVLFVTGNDEKFGEAKRILSDRLNLEQIRMDLPELQGDAEEIVREKARIAADKTGKACIVDDTCLGFDAWNGLPGPYIKHFREKLGVARLADLLIKSDNDPGGCGKTLIAYCEPSKEPKVFIGKIKGRIVKSRGTGNMQKGWDQIFVPEGHDKTYAEMATEVKHENSPRQLALTAFHDWLINK